METVYLLIKQQVNEADNRVQGTSGATGAVTTGPGGVINAYDWRVWNASGFGRQLQGALQAGRGYSFEVTDFGQYVSCRASFHSVATGKSITKHFVVAFDNPKRGDGKVFATSTKWRTISNVQQAASYINQSIRAIAGAAESNNG